MLLRLLRIMIILLLLLMMDNNHNENGDADVTGDYNNTVAVIDDDENASYINLKINLWKWS